MAAYRLKESLIKNYGDIVNSVVYNAKESNIDETVFQFDRSESSIINQIINSNIYKNRSEKSNTLFSSPLQFSVNGIQNIHFQPYSILNLHWVSQFLSINDIGNLINTGLPIVWTLHDEAPYTGGCHYTAGCNKFKSDCKDCPQLMKDEHLIPHHTLEYKKELFPEDIVIVAPSKWLTKRAGQSALFQNNRIEYIPNGIDAEIFKTHDSLKARKNLNIKNDTFLLLFGAMSANEKRKGFRLLLEMIDILEKDPEFAQLFQNKKIEVISFGQPPQELEKRGVGVENVGFVKDEKKLSEIYSAADLFILPSLEDNLPNTMLESMSSGTPVLTFKIGGMPDVIKHNVNGLLVRPFDTQAMAVEFKRYYQNNTLRGKLSKNARQTIINNFTLKHQADRYQKLFTELLEKYSQKKPERLSKEQLKSIPDIPPGLVNLYIETAEKMAQSVQSFSGSTFDVTNVDVNAYRLGYAILHPLKTLKKIVRFLYHKLPSSYHKLVLDKFKKNFR